MFEIDELIEMGISKNMDDENMFVVLCDAIYSVTMCGDNSEYEKIIIKAIDDGYEIQVCSLIKQLWTYHSKFCERLRGN
ncbi:hypothetical protein KPL42_03000 [Clostridium gasigenes]|uniref:hypothetical protein n=1 Tax=Clostridium gasigenes TaxID=94869 RepID=UPI001C0DBBA1|nr:hypothetical protein [Clostridium gasigenes]MBU3087455.1 hypothetical protein [Clostridium gasigenes]